MDPVAKKPTIALVLSSGGASGYAHIGAIEELQSRGYHISSIAGCSMGALVGGIYALGKLDVFHRWLLGLNMKKIFGLTDFSVSLSHWIKGEKILPNQRIKVYVVEVKDNPKGPKVMLSRTHPELVRKLFFDEVSELKEGIVEIKAIAREAGSRTKMAVLSHDEDVDAVGACVGLNGNRVNTIVEELRGEKIDIINYDENPAYLIENALSPAKVIAVIADQDNKDALVIVPDNQLSLAIGKEGQNARLAAKLTNYKIDIKSESQAQEQGIFDEMGIDYHGDGENYDEGYDEDAYNEEEYEDGESYEEEE